MPQEIKNPVRLADRARNSSVCLAAMDEVEHTSLASEVQRRRACWLARRVSISTVHVDLIAALAFETEAAR